MSLADRSGVRPRTVALRTFPRTIFIDLETTGLSGGAGTVAFLVGCGFFDLGAFQVRQFLLTSYASERALLHAVAEFFKDADLIVTYNGKTFDVPVMETRWLFHRLQMPLDNVPHFDMLHPARRLWRARSAASRPDDGGCRLSTLERTLFNVSRSRATLAGSRYRRGSSASCAAAIRVRSSQCSNTIDSISCRWPRSWLAPSN